MLEKIKYYFNAEYIKIYDNTKYHTIKNNKKHITILIVSNKFIDQNLLQRHQAVYKLLSQEINNIIYAISIHTYTISEWNKNKIKNITLIPCKNKSHQII